MIYGALIIGLFGLITNHNLIQKLMCINIIQSCVILLFLSLGKNPEGSAPILTGGVLQTVDPLPQALMLTSIVIGVCFNALAAALLIRLHRRYGTLDIRYLHER